MRNSLVYFLFLGYLFYNACLNDYGLVDPFMRNFLLLFFIHHYFRVEFTTFLL